MDIQDKYGSFDAYIWSYSDGKSIVYNKHPKGYIPASNGLSAKFSKDFKRRGCKYTRC